MCWEKCLHPLIRVSSVNVLFPGLTRWHSSLPEKSSPLTEKHTGETSYYLTSLAPDLQVICQAVRSHWAVENKLHWSLFIFREDASLKKKDHSVLNFNTIAKMALALLDQEKSTKKSKPSKRLLAALDDDYRAKVLNI